MTQNQMKDTRAALKFTRMCKYWSGNRCHLGTECNFAHSEAELRNQPDLVSTQLCFQFARKGTCKNGEACNFAHGKSELRRLPKADKKVSHVSPQARPVERVESQAADIAAVTSISVLRMAMGADMGLDMAGLAGLSPVAAHVDAAVVGPPPGLGPLGPLGPDMQDMPGMVTTCLSPPPGLDVRGARGTGAADPRLFAETLRASLESSRGEFLLQDLRDSLEDDPLTPPRTFSKSSRKTDVTDVGTGSTVSLLFSGYPSDSEPASPKTGPIWF